VISEFQTKGFELRQPSLLSLLFHINGKAPQIPHPKSAKLGASLGQNKGTLTFICVP